MEKRLHARDAIFDPAPDVDDERAFTPAAYLPSPDADPAKLVETADFNEDASVRMAAAIRTLDDRSRHIIESRWLSEDKLTRARRRIRYLGGKGSPGRSQRDQEASISDGALSVADS
jgi:DNA-directed RNA polymerase sigma subunit (sigma70/sigma32)